MQNIPHLKITLVVSFILIAAGIEYAGWKTWSDKTKVSNHIGKTGVQQNLEDPSSPLSFLSSTAEIHSVTDTSNWKMYRNDKLGISFKYPYEWGEVKEYILAKQNDNLVLSGKQITLYFDKLYHRTLAKSSNTYAEGTVDLSSAQVTLTFTEPGFQYGGWPLNGNWSGFTGNKNDLVCPSSNFDCKPIANLSAPSVSYFQPAGVRGDIGVYFIKHVKIVSPHPQYKGLSIDFNMDIIYPRTSQEYQNYNQEAVEKFIRTTLLEIKNRTAEKKVIEELDQFDAMVETVVFFN